VKKDHLDDTESAQSELPSPEMKKAITNTSASKTETYIDDHEASAVLS